jgi:heme-degrading monooxygenase HmoA
MNRGDNSYQLAQINVGRFLYDRKDAANADFMNGLDPVNAQADAADGFIWRLVGDGNDATELVPDEDDPQLLVNMSVWRDVDALGAFVYKNADHLAFMRRRKEWFEKIEIFMALYWVPAGHIPNVAEGMERVAMLRAHGPTLNAFTFQHAFDPPITG